MKISELKKTAKELNEFLGVEPPIDVKLKAEELTEKIKEASTMLEDGEEEELSKVACAVLEEINASEEDEEEIDDTPEEEDEELDLEDMVKTAKDLKALKLLAKDDETFKPLRKGLAKVKDVKVLRADMLSLLKGEQAPADDKKANKVDKKKVVKKTTGKIVPRTAFGSAEGSQAAAIDNVFLKKISKVITLDTFEKETGLGKNRIKGHMIHLTKKKGFNIEIKTNKEGVLTYKYTK